MNLRVKEMSEFDVILGIEWLTVHRIVIDCDCMRVTAYTLDGTCVTFQGDKYDALPRALYDSRWHGDSCHGRVIRNQQNLFPIFLLLP